MSDHQETAYVTGGGSGLGKATATMLVKKGIRVFIADRDLESAQNTVKELNKEVGRHLAQCATFEASEWNSQAKTFTQAVSALGRVDNVYAIAGIGERRWLPKIDPHMSTTGFEQPDLGVLDVDLAGALYTIGLAIQQFRRQEVHQNTGFRGRISCVASVCGFYCSPTLPIYTAAKHGLVGFVRSYGKYLPKEHISLNAVCPNIVRTNISTAEFYDSLAADGLLTPVEGITETFEALLDGELKNASGETYEVGPNYGKNGQKWVTRTLPEYLDQESKTCIDRLEVRGYPLQVPH